MIFFLSASGGEKATQGCPCGHLDDAARVCRRARTERSLLDAAVRRFGLSERARHRVLKVARTIADLSADEEINTAHLSEAVGFRVLDRHAEDG